MRSTMSISGVKKGVAYKLQWMPVDTSGNTSTGAVGQTIYRISKDGGAYVACTNVVTIDPVESRGVYLQLTAEEMDANVIDLMLVFTKGGAASHCSVTITTGGPGNSTVTTSFSPGVLAFMFIAYDNGYVISKQDTDNSGFNYYGFLNSNGVWVILQEATDFSTIKYLLENGTRQTFDDGWTNRTTLGYTDTQPLKGRNTK